MLFVLVAVALIAAACSGSSGGDELLAPPQSDQAAPTATAPPNDQQAAPPSDEANDAQAGQAGQPTAPAETEAGAPQSDPAQQATEEDEALVTPLPYDNESAIAVIRELSVGIGLRVQGTPGGRAAADFLQRTFESFGYQVERQRFQVPTFVVERLVVTADGAVLDASAFNRSAGGALQGRLVAVPGLGDAADFAQVDVSGAIALVERGVLFFQQKVDNAEAAGAAGIIIFNNEPGLIAGELMSGSNIPAVSISRTDGRALREAAQAGEVSASIRLDGGQGFAQSQNVIARPRSGSCRIYVGGHYDTVIGVPGANDNASGTALVVELARVFAGSSGVEQVCFVGFGAEENVNGSSGIFGSRILAQSLEEAGEATSILAMLNLDVAANGQRLLLVGTPALREMAQALADALGVRAEPGGLPQGIGSDHLNFQAIGVPVIFPTVFGASIHTPDDNFAAIRPEQLDDVGRLAHAILACLIARADGPLAPPAACEIESAGP